MCSSHFEIPMNNNPQSENAVALRQLAHDLRNQLSTLLLQSEGLEVSLRTVHLDDHANQARDIVQTVEKMNTTINEALGDH